MKDRVVAKHFHFLPYQDEKALKYSLSAPDAHWISLRPTLEGLVLPSKFYGIAAVARPILAITAADGEIACLIRQHQCGLVIEPGNAQGLAEAILFLCENRQEADAMGSRARAMLESHFGRRQALARWRETLAPIA